jgi:hypothetical protein
MRSSRVSRRDAIGLLGTTAGFGLCSTLLRGGGPFEPLEASARIDNLGIPKDAIIRTVLRDVRPADLGQGATMFHEHLSLSDPFPF